MILSSTNNFNNNVALFVFLGVAVIAIFLIIFFSILNKKKNDRVLLASSYIKKIKEINKEYVFQTLTSVSDTKTFHLNSKRAFDNFDFYRRRNEFIKDNIIYYQQVVQKINTNVSLFSDYKTELSMVRTTSDESLAKENKMSLKSFKKREIKLGRKMIKCPQTTYSLRIKWEYTSPAGRNHYSYYRDCSFNDIQSIVQQLTVAKKTYYSEPRTRNTYTPPRTKPTERVYTNDDIEDIEE